MPQILQVRGESPRPQFAALAMVVWVGMVGHLDNKMQGIRTPETGAPAALNLVLMAPLFMEAKLGAHQMGPFPM